MARSVDQARGSNNAGRRRAGGDPLLRGLRLLSGVVTGIVAVVTLLPSEVEDRIPLLAERDELNGVLVFAIVVAVVVALVVAAWKSRIAWRLKMSSPLFLVGAVYLGGLAMLASAPLRATVLGLFSTSPAWLDHLSTLVDGGHVAAYAAFMIIVVMAWREKVGPLWLALALFAYGYGLELLQELVPGRQYQLSDIGANGLGIAIGLIGAHLFDLRAAMRKGRTVHVPTSG
jgi:VanZ family protein